LLPEGADSGGAVCPGCGHALRSPDDRQEAIQTAQASRRNEGLTEMPRALGLQPTPRPPRAVKAPDDVDSPAALPIGGIVAILSVILIVGAVLALFRGPEGRDFIEGVFDAVRDWEFPAPVVVVGIGVLCAVVWGCSYAVSVKARVVRALIDVVEFRATSPAEFPRLDEHRLREYTRALEALGFRHLTDYTLVKTRDNGLTAYARLFVHDSWRCYAEVNEVYNARGTASPMRCNLMSFLEDGWSVSNSDRRPRRGNYLIRRPRALWRSLPDRTPHQLLEAHLELRDQVAGDIGLAAVGDGSAGDYFRRVAEASDERGQRVRRRPAWSFVLDSWVFELSPKLEWLGEYAANIPDNQGRG
jgi:hypothetical protein